MVWSVVFNANVDNNIHYQNSYIRLHYQLLVLTFTFVLLFCDKMYQLNFASSGSLRFPLK